MVKKFDFKSTGKTLAKKQRTIEEAIEPQAIGVKTPLQFGNQSDLVHMHFDPASQIRDNFRNLLLTNHGERLGMFDFGADLRTLALEGDNLSESEFGTEAASRISQAVAKYMPFIDLNTFSSRFIVNSHNNTKQVELDLSYDVLALGIFNQGIKLTFHLGGLTKSVRGIDSSQYETGSVSFVASAPTGSIPDDYYMWLNARDIDGDGTNNASYTDGQNISSWTPVAGSNSPNGSFVGAATNLYPLYIEDGINGQAAISFGQDTDNLVDELVWDQFTTDHQRFHEEAWTMFIVMKPFGIDAETSQWIITNEEGTLSNRRGFGLAVRRFASDGVAGGRETNRTFAPYVLNSTTSDFINMYTSNEAYENNEVILLRLKPDFADDNEVYKDGLILTASNTQGSPYTLGPSVNQLTVGGRSRASTSYFSGAIGDIILFDRLTTDEEDQDIEIYLRNIYGDFNSL